MIEETDNKIQKKRGRPRKNSQTNKQPKLSLIEKQQIKLEAQHKKQAEKIANGEIEPKNKDRFYCTNKELHQELLKWRNSSKFFVPVMKLVDGKMINTVCDSTPEGHEIYQDGIRYFVKLSTKDDSSLQTVWNHKKYKYITDMTPGPIRKLYNKALKQLSDYKKTATDKSQYDHFYKEHKDYVIHEITEIVKCEGWTFNYDNVDDRVVSDKLGNMMIAIGNKLLNHSSFRNYDQELKLDMRGQFFVKLIRGLKNYNFKFNNPFAFFTTCAWNSFLTILGYHYQHQNIRKSLMEKMAAELQSYTGISPNNSLSRCIKTYLGDDFGKTDS